MAHRVGVPKGMTNCVWMAGAVARCQLLQSNLFMLFCRVQPSQGLVNRSATAQPQLLLLPDICHMH